MSRYKINIMEHQYYINTDRDPAWVKMLQERLNGQIDEIREGCPNLSAFDTFALLTMNLMDQLAKSEEAAANLRQQLTNYLRESSAVRAPGDGKPAVDESAPGRWTSGTMTRMTRNFERNGKTR